LALKRIPATSGSASGSSVHHLGDRPLLRHPGAVDRERGTVGRELKQRHVVLAEPL